MLSLESECDQHRVGSLPHGELNQGSLMNYSYSVRTDANFSALHSLGMIDDETRAQIKPQIVISPKLQRNSPEKLLQVLEGRGLKSAIGQLAILNRPALPVFIEMRASKPVGSNYLDDACAQWKRLCQAGYRITPLLDASFVGDLRIGMAESVLKISDGFSIIININQLQDAELFSEIKKSIGWINGLVNSLEIVIDVGNVSEGHLYTLPKKLAFYVGHLSSELRVSKVIMTGSAFPGSISHLDTFRIGVFTRFEWLLWDTVRELEKKFPTVFGDSGPICRNYIPRRPPNRSHRGNLRYTIDRSYFAIRGVPDVHHNLWQYKDLAHSLVKRPEFRGRDFARPERRISNVANAIEGTPKFWASTALQQHIIFVTRQIGDLKDPEVIQRHA